MAQLTKGMYGDEFNPTGDLFGLYCRQMRGGKTKLTHNSGWYNKSGEKLGWGDLSTKDFRKISRELKNGELFIILSESDSYWNFITPQHGPLNKMAKKKGLKMMAAPGVDYVTEHAMYIIARNQLYCVDRYGDSKKKTEKRGGLQFKVLKLGAAKALITAVVSA